MECRYGCLRDSGHPLSQVRSGRIKLTVPYGAFFVLAVTLLVASAFGSAEAAAPNPSGSGGAPIPIRVDRAGILRDLRGECDRDLPPYRDGVCPKLGGSSPRVTQIEMESVVLDWTFVSPQD